MVKKSTNQNIPDAAEYGRSLKRGLSVNLLVKDVEASVGFATHVLGAEAVYADEDFAILRQTESGAEWMVHADHTYSDHRLSGLVRSVQGRGTGAEIRLYGLDPDRCEAKAREWGYTVLDGTTDKPHGTREVYIFDPDWYLWVPTIPRGE